MAGVASKLRALRQARVNALLPLVEEARRSGCVSLSEMCRYLDQIGHKPTKGEKWSRGTLSQMLPPVTDEERQARDADRQERDDKFAALIAQARAEGALTIGDVADWLNTREYRTANDKQWTRSNIFRFEKAYRQK